MTPAADHLRTSAVNFDHASKLPRKPSLANIDDASVYFIAGAGLIKIGVSTNVRARFRAIRNSSPVEVVLLGMVPGGTLEESFLHCSFPHLRRHGEWFEDTPELRQHIERCIAERRAISAW
jgi:T5orf172 domain